MMMCSSNKPRNSRVSSPGPRRVPKRRQANSRMNLSSSLKVRVVNCNRLKTMQNMPLAKPKRHLMTWRRQLSKLAKGLLDYPDEWATGNGIDGKCESAKRYRHDTGSEIAHYDIVSSKESCQEKCQANPAC